MARTTVTLDDDLIEDARRLLGTSGISETVNAALMVAIRQARLAAFDIRRFEITEGAKVPAPRVSGQAVRWLLLAGSLL
ncbi:MAG: type II toxin-antitoxin system VapB family antitoxin [Pseudonocardiaceae bacterium]